MARESPSILGSTIEGTRTLPSALLLVLSACGGHGAGVPPPPPTDAYDAGSEAGAEASLPAVPNPEGGSSCTVGLSGMTRDPVALCFQGDLLTAEVTKAYVMGQGVAAAWDDAGHTSGHAWQDDLGLASAIASFVCSAEFYGNGQYASLYAVLEDLAGVLPKELPPSPAGYDGEIYFRLRNAEAGYHYVNDEPHAAVFRSLADDYGRATASTYAQSVAAGGDAGTTQVVLGTPDASGGVDYAPAQVIMGAAALLDMALLYGGDPDAGSDPSAWRAAALAALDYVWARGRDPATGLFYGSLVTSGDPGHDALLPVLPANDALLTDVQAAAVLGLARVQAKVDALARGVDAASDAAALDEPYLAEADALVLALAGSSGPVLWDGSTSPGTTPGAFLEGIVPSAGGALLTNKTTVGNALLLAGIHRLAVVRGTTASYVLGQLRAALLEDMAGHSSLFTVVTNASGFPTQDGFLRASSRDWGYATVFAPDGGGQEEPGAREYRADAANAVAEGFEELWYGGQNAPACAP